MLESVQRRMTKRIQRMRASSLLRFLSFFLLLLSLLFRDMYYIRPIKMLNLHLLERHRLRGELIAVFKWCRGYNKGDVSKIPRTSNQDRKRNNRFKMERSS